LLNFNAKLLRYHCQTTAKVGRPRAKSGQVQKTGADVKVESRQLGRG